MDVASARMVRTACAVLILTGLEACQTNEAPKIDAHTQPLILLFAGTGTSPNDVAAVKAVLNDSHLSYSAADSFQLNGISESQLSRYRLLIVPGGNFVYMGNSLSDGTTTKVRNAVAGGVNYLGLCAGGFLAGSFPPPYHGFSLSSGVKFGFYSAEKKGTRKAAVSVATPHGPALDQYWEDGPEFTGWGDVAGRYPDGTPAIVEGFAGQGWVILSGVHPEAPENWRQGLDFRTSAEADHAFAADLIRAALNREQLPHY